MRLGRAHAQYLTFWSCFSGVFEQEGGHVGQTVGENRAPSAVFFPKTNTHLNPVYLPSIVWELKKRGRETVDSQWQCTGRSGRTAVKRCNDSVFKLVEIWKKQKFFFPTTSTFELSETIVVFCKGPAQLWGRAWTNLPSNCAFQTDVTFNF